MHSSTFNKFSAWSGLYYILITGVAWAFFISIIPAHSPSASATDIAALYQSNQLGISLGAVLMLFSCFFLSLYGAVVLKLIYKIEQQIGLLTINMAFSFVMAIVITMITAVAWGTAAFRVDRAPKLIQALNDFGWLTFFSTAPPIFFAFLGFTLAAFTQQNKQLNIIPKWYGLLNLWVLIALIPGPLCLIFKTGPFAWNGLIVYWFAFVVFGLNFILSPKVLVPAVNNHLNAS